MQRYMSAGDSKFERNSRERESNEGDDLSKRLVEASGETNRLIERLFVEASNDYTQNAFFLSEVQTMDHIGRL